MNSAFHPLRAFLIIFCICCTGVAFAQTTDISPYSRYGIGDLQAQNSVLNFSMGGTGIAYHNDASTPFFINLKNPASYAYGFIPIDDSTGTGGLKMIAFEAGIQENILNISSIGQSAKSNNANFSYAALNIPVSRHVGLAMGIVPVSTEGYNINTNPYIDSDGVPSKTTTVLNNYQGTGGISKIFIGTAYAPWKNLSFGANLSYLFGNLTNTESVDFNNTNFFNTLKAENIGVHSFAADFGLMYTFTIKNKKDAQKNWYVTLGATVAPSANLTANYNVLTVTQSASGSNIDTLQDSGAVGKIRIPIMYGAGITIKKGDQWTFSFDYTVQNWAQFSYFGENENLSNTTTYGVGIQYVPKKDFNRNYAQRIHYRVGYSYSTNYLDLYNTPLKDQSFSVGVGLPLGNPNPLQYPAVLNIALRVGSMGTTTNNLLKQNYFQIMFGFTFDDHWFDKRKFN